MSIGTLSFSLKILLYDYLFVCFVKQLPNTYLELQMAN